MHATTRARRNELPTNLIEDPHAQQCRAKAHNYRKRATCCRMGTIITVSIRETQPFYYLTLSRSLELVTSSEASKKWGRLQLRLLKFDLDLVHWAYINHRVPDTISTIMIEGEQNELERITASSRDGLDQRAAFLENAIGCQTPTLQGASQELHW